MPDVLPCLFQGLGLHYQAIGAVALSWNVYQDLNMLWQIDQRLPDKVYLKVVDEAQKASES